MTRFLTRLHRLLSKLRSTKHSDNPGANVYTASHSYIYANRDGDCDQHSNVHTSTDGYAHADENADRHQHGHSHTDQNANCDGDTLVFLASSISFLVG